jgi:hypothetical protein
MKRADYERVIFKKELNPNKVKVVQFKSKKWRDFE